MEEANFFRIMLLALQAKVIITRVMLGHVGLTLIYRGHLKEIGKKCCIRNNINEIINPREIINNII